MKFPKSALAFCAGIIFSVVSMSAKGQLFKDTNQLKPLPRITGWADNNQYIEEKWNRPERKYDAFSVNIKTGKETIYPLPEKSKAISVRVKEGDVFLESPTNDKRQLTKTEAEEKLPELSPDNKWVAFLRNNDLYITEISTGKETRLTHDGAETIMNGNASWVYYEEIFGRSSKYRAFWWAPDSRHIAFYRFDDSKVPMYPLFNSTGQHGFTEHTRYPQPGDPNPEVRIGIASVDGSVVWARFDEKADQYFGTPFWRPDGSSLQVQWMPREQNNLKLYEINLTSGARTEIYNEEQPTWINWIDRLKWIKDGFLMVRDFDGWEQIYYYDNSGKLKKKLTTGKNWRTRIYRVDEKTKTLFYYSNGEISTRADFYSVQLDGSRQRRLTFGDFSHSKILLSSDARFLITTYSNSLTPSRMALVDLKNGTVKNIADSKGNDYDSTKIERRDVVWMKTDDGLELPGRITWPVNMEAGKKYPVIINIYGGPNYQAVEDEWVVPGDDDESNPVIRVGFAHRGSGDLGKAGLNYLYRNLGKWEMHDYIEWAKWLRKNPFIDTAKIMITGGSYGGYLTAMALTYGAQYFKYGISNYPVTDWALYDSHYTERYMDEPKDNPQGYQFGSVMTHAGNYQKFGSSMLLLAHGAMDDNVHIQNTYQLVDTLQKLNKPFELMVFPGERHGWRGPKIPFTVDLRNRFIQKYLFDKN